MPDALMAKKLPKLNYFAWEKYLDSVAPIKALASITRTETAALLESRDSILPKLMTGEIDVSKIGLTQLNSHLLEFDTILEVLDWCIETAVRTVVCVHAWMVFQEMCNALIEVAYELS